MVKFIYRRLFLSVITLIIMSLIIFFSINLILTDYEKVFGNAKILWESLEAAESALNQGKELKGLNEPLLIQYFNWIGGIFKGDFGESIMSESFYPE